MSSDKIKFPHFGSYYLRRGPCRHAVINRKYRRAAASRDDRSPNINGDYRKLIIILLNSLVGNGKIAPYSSAAVVRMRRMMSRRRRQNKAFLNRVIIYTRNIYKRNAATVGRLNRRRAAVVYVSAVDGRQTERVDYSCAPTNLFACSTIKSAQRSAPCAPSITRS